MSITFDANSATENNCDYIVFYKDSSHTDVYGENKYSGKFFPGLNGNPALEIPSDKFVLHFRSDGSVTDVGSINSSICTMCVTNKSARDVAFTCHTHTDLFRVILLFYFSFLNQLKNIFFAYNSCLLLPEVGL